MVISSRQNPKIKKIASLKEKKYRLEYGLYVVEGIKMVKEAINFGVELEMIAGVPSVLSALPETSAEIVEVDEKIFEALTETKSPQGVIAVLKIPENTMTPPRGNCVVLDGVSDPGNLGTIIRTCVAVGIKDVYLCNCVDAFSPKVIRSTMSGIFAVDIHSFDRETVLGLVSSSTLVVADMDGESVFEANIPSPYAIVIGNEANGVSPLLKSKADKTVSIPMCDGIERLNAAVSFGITAYTLSKGKIK